MGFSLINHPILGSILGNLHIVTYLPGELSWFSMMTSKSMELCSVNQSFKRMGKTQNIMRRRWLLLHGGFPEIGVPLVIIHFKRSFLYKPTILGCPPLGDPRLAPGWSCPKTPLWAACGSRSRRWVRFYPSIYSSTYVLHVLHLYYIRSCIKACM